MSGMHGISSSGSMSKNCNMKSMHENSKMNTREATQKEAAKQVDIKQDSIPNQIFGNKVDIKI